MDDRVKAIRSHALEWAKTGDQQAADYLAEGLINESIPYLLSLVDSQAQRIAELERSHNLCKEWNNKLLTREAALTKPLTDDEISAAVLEMPEPADGDFNDLRDDLRVVLEQFIAQRSTNV